MHKDFIIVGCYDDDGDATINSCLQFDTNDFNLIEVAAMNEECSKEEV